MSKRGLAVTAAILIFGIGIHAASGQGMMAPPGAAPPQCMAFQSLNADTQQKANAVGAAMKAKADRKEVCKLMTVFVAAEGKVVKFLIDNKTWCGVPEQVVVNAKASHEKSTKFRDAACAEQAQPKAPSLSDAIKTTPVDSAKNTNTKTGGTFDTLTGNPLGR